MPLTSGQKAIVAGGALVGGYLLYKSGKIPGIPPSQSSGSHISATASISSPVPVGSPVTARVTVTNSSQSAQTLTVTGSTYNSNGQVIGQWTQQSLTLAAGASKTVQMTSSTAVPQSWASLGTLVAQFEVN